ncbi:MAG: DUF5331 domain-containing protein [Dolichospermum sp.]|jgi:hypothetical protein|uniref:DUF5331 domain-containing protein n=1 Tax=Dolichospermum circinale TaxID=109265 RepID=UPI00040C8936|nr:DUF5331 domain-containing protein [Dolichospermum circinale]MBD1214948.1 hypothetical protein [Dolichospermum circinale Clear-D4]MDB9484693.1 DUF5331 domain-containing protein [Dolichospermum circinale CS-537/05]MDB9453202.1 DUF5331 domain-containing protein [Dolichospermum circinale CS-541/06]MDB9460867.1 DUF5331 domain-containing protein [Dolichospermum circinale CS-541/04]MDB9476791.1 DUF5331 domain-containing protein [Dolichospermum circinale CS-537/11]
MDIEHLRQSLKIKWLSYYEQNRSWLVKMRIWKDYDGIRRPSSGYIIATLSILESELKKILPFILDLNNNPDQIIAALGLHFNPEQELNSLRSQHSTAKNEIVSTSPIRIPLTDLSVTKERKQVLLKMNTGVSVVAVATPVYDRSLVKPPVPVGREQIATEISKIPSQNILFTASHSSSSLPSWIDEFCRGRGNG